MKSIFKVLLASVVALSLSSCGGQGAKNSKEATPENPMILTLAHGLSETHTVHLAIKQFADELAERTNGRIQVKIFANGQLGSELEQMEQVMAGVISMTKVSSPMLATYQDAYHGFGLPYIFNDTKDFYQVMDSPEMYEFFKTSYDKGFVTLTYYTSGSRSFYTVNRAIRNPADLHGLKIRVQDMRSQTEMIDVMGGTPVAMAYGDVFTSLQTGVIDGTENNETALTLGKHGEICKVYSMDQHAMIPDALVISSKIWDELSPEDRLIMEEAARHSTTIHQGMWDQAVEDAIAEASAKMGVTFVYDVDKDAFRQATSGMLDKYSQEYPGVKKLLTLIKEIRTHHAAAPAQPVAAAQTEPESTAAPAPAAVVKAAPAAPAAPAAQAEATEAIESPESTQSPESTESATSAAPNTTAEPATAPAATDSTHDIAPAGDAA